MNACIRVLIHVFSDRCIQTEAGSTPVSSPVLGRAQNAEFIIPAHNAILIKQYTTYGLVLCISKVNAAYGNMRTNLALYGRTSFDADLVRCAAYSDRSTPGSQINAATVSVGSGRPGCWRGGGV